jgi:hypothetical protein
MRARLPLLAGIAATALLVAGCKKHEEQPPVQNEPVAQPEPVAPPPPPPVEPAPKPKPILPKAKPAPEVSADQQVIDDADATGMTAHVNRAQNNADSSSTDHQ